MESTPSSQQLVRLLADEARRKIVAALILHDGPLSSAAVADAAGLSAREAVDAVTRLTAGGLVAEAGGGYSLLDHVFQQAARAEAPPAEPSAHDDLPAEVAHVLDGAFRDGKLLQWPAKRSKRLFVLDYLAQQFEIGKRYTEAEVNIRLRQFDDDVATMRRYLVDEQFLDRGYGEYWRCGGSF